MPAGLREGRSLQRGVRLLGGYHGGSLSPRRLWARPFEGIEQGSLLMGYRTLRSIDFALSAETNVSPSASANVPGPKSFKRSSFVWVAAGAIAASAAGAAMVLANEKPASGSDISDMRSHLHSAIVSLKGTASELAEHTAHKASTVAEHASLAAAHASEALHATVVLLQCLASVLVAEEEAGSGPSDGWWAPQVTATVADFAANDKRRKAIAKAGNGKVVRWLLRSVSGENGSVRREASRAVAWLLSDESTARAVLAQEGAVRHLLEFAGTLDHHALAQGMEGGAGADPNPLVDAIMDLITSSDPARDCALLATEAAEEDMAAALAVLREVDMEAGEEPLPATPRPAGTDRRGANGAEAPVSGVAAARSTPRMAVSGATLANEGLTAGSDLATGMQGSGLRAALCEPAIDDAGPPHQKLPPLSHLGQGRQRRQARGVGIGAARKGLKGGEPGLWEDLSGRSVAVVLAAWALATWTQASAANRLKIAELDRDGTAFSVGALAPERSVRWHMASAATALLRGRAGGDHPWAEAVGERWSEPLLGAALSAGLQQDAELACCALEALTACVESSRAAQALVARAGLGALRELARQREDDPALQQALAHALCAVASQGEGLSADEGKQWSPVLLSWACGGQSRRETREAATRVLERLLERLGQSGIAITQAWLAKLLMALVAEAGPRSKSPSPAAAAPGRPSKKGALQGQIVQEAALATAQLARVVAQEAAAAARQEWQSHMAADLLGTGGVQPPPLSVEKEAPPGAQVGAREALAAVARAVKALTELAAEQPAMQERILGAGGLPLLRHLLVGKEYERWLAEEEREEGAPAPTAPGQEARSAARMRKHAARLLKLLAAHEEAWPVLAGDSEWVEWLERCADGQVAGNEDCKSRSYARAVLLHAAPSHHRGEAAGGGESEGLQGGAVELAPGGAGSGGRQRPRGRKAWPRYEDCVNLMDPAHPYLKHVSLHPSSNGVSEHAPSPASLASAAEEPTAMASAGSEPEQASSPSREDPPAAGREGGQGGVPQWLRPVPERAQGLAAGAWAEGQEPVLDVVFVHGLCGGPFKTWRTADPPPRSAVGVVEGAAEEEGSSSPPWPGQWLSQDLPSARGLTVKYKTNLSEWKGATLPLQELSGMLLETLWAAGVGQRPVVFVCHSMGGLIVKQMLAYAQEDPRYAPLLQQTRGAVFYSTPHWGSKLADMPWRMGLVLRPAPSVEDLRSTSPRLDELNRTLRQLHQKGQLAVLSFSETLLSPVVRAYGGIALRMEVVPIESAYPGFGDIVVLEGTDHVNSCKPKNRSDIIYTKTLELLQSIEANILREQRQKATTQQEQHPGTADSLID